MAETALVKLRLLKGEPNEMADMQRVIEGAPRYAEVTTGAPPGPADAQSTYSIVPEGKTYDDKLVYGVYAGEVMVGCADLIRGYPNSSTAFLGLLLIAERYQRRGFGRAAYEAIEEAVRGFGSCDRIRLGVVRTNANAIPFWSAMGFEPTGEVKPYRSGVVTSEAILFEKPLRLSR